MKRDRVYISGPITGRDLAEAQPCIPLAPRRPEERPDAAPDADAGERIGMIVGSDFRP